MSQRAIAASVLAPGRMTRAAGAARASSSRSAEEEEDFDSEGEGRGVKQKEGRRFRAPKLSCTLAAATCSRNCSFHRSYVEVCMSVCLHPNFYFTIKHLQSRMFQACIHKCIKNLRRGFGQNGVPLWRLCSSRKKSRFMCEHSCAQRIQIIQTRVCFSNNPSIAVGWRLRRCVHRPERAMQSFRPGKG